MVTLMFRLPPNETLGIRINVNVKFMVKMIQMQFCVISRSSLYSLFLPISRTGKNILNDSVFLHLMLVFHIVRSIGTNSYDQGLHN